MTARALRVVETTRRSLGYVVDARRGGLADSLRPAPRRVVFAGSNRSMRYGPSAFKLCAAAPLNASFRISTSHRYVLRQYVGAKIKHFDKPDKNKIASRQWWPARRQA
jgi:hypothetical protein